MLMDEIVGVIMEQIGGCSPFFVTSSVLSSFNVWKNRKSSKENALANEEFQKELQRQKEVYEDQKEAEEWAFRFWLRKKQREFAYEENSHKLEHDLQRADLQMFFKDWPLQISIEAINDKRKKLTSEFLPFSVVVGKHIAGKENDSLALLYDALVDEIKPTLSNLGVNESYIYRFKEDVNVCGGAALAYIYSMMNTFPVVVILPSVDERHGKYNISVGLWNQDSLFPLQKKVFSLDFNSYRMQVDKEYLKAKVEEIKMSYIALSAVLNDSYSLVENNGSLTFPKYANQYKISSTYPQIVDFAIAEYESLLKSCQSTARGMEATGESFYMLYSQKEQKRMAKVLAEGIQTLKS